MCVVEPLRVRALKRASSFVGHRERAYNSSPLIDIWLRASGVPVGTPWCAAFVISMLRSEGFDEQVRHSASVGFLFAHARAQGWIVERPYRGDLVAFNLDEDGWPDHTGFVERVLALGPVLMLRTVEGNTSSGAAGSQDDGDGVFRRTRVVRRSSVVFARVPG